MKQPRFKYYMSGTHIDRPEPFYSMWVEAAHGYSDVSGQTLIDQGHPVPLTPTFDTWRDLVRSKKKCGRCFASTKNTYDMAHHNQTNHMGVSAYVPV